MRAPMSSVSTSLLALATTVALAAEPVVGVDLPVSEVTLFSSGVGTFVHAGTVQGDATAELRFRTGQINDVLKSLVLEDLNGGTVGTVGYPSQDPLEKTLKSFQVDVSGNPPLAGLLNQLRGARVQVQVLDATIDGIVIGCEQRTKVLPQNGGTEVTWVLNILENGSLRPLALADVRTVKPTDPALQAELGKALAALAQSRDQDKKPVSLSFRGQGQRRVRLQYVAEAPVWKASYRLLLGKDKDPTNLQGWAIVENPTDSDWTDVKLTLVSGRPVSFIQDLYRPLYAHRPEVATELQSGLRPVAYGGGIGGEKGKAELQGRAAPKPSAAPGMAMAAEQAKSYRLRAGAESDKPMDAMAADDGRSFNASSSIQIATQSVAEVGELFAYNTGKVTIPRQRSAMIPFVGSAILCEKVSIYNRNVLSRNPLSGARLTNTTGNSLSAGPMTVYDDGTYAGDAQLTQLPPGQVRLVSFAIDQRVVVDSEKERSDQRRTLAKIVRGVLEIQVVTFQGRTYVADNQGDADKNLIIEHGRNASWTLYETPAALETTEHLYRFKLAVPARKKTELVVTERFVNSERMALFASDANTIAAFIDTKDLKPAVKDALVRTRGFIDAVNHAEHARENVHQQLKAIAEDQERIRRNVNSVDRSSYYAKRLMTKLNEQETTLDQLRVKDEQLLADINAKRKELADYVSNLTVE